MLVNVLFTLPSCTTAAHLHPPHRRPRNVAFGASGVLLLNYVGAIATALLSAPGVFRRGVMIGGHAAAAVWLIVSTLKLKAEEVSSIKEYYKQIWNLFYFEYLLYFCI